MAAHLLKSLLLRHVYALNRQFVPIQKVDKTVTFNKQYHYGVPLFIILFTVSYGTLYLPYESSSDGDDPNWLSHLSTNRHTVFHQMVPRSFWEKFDIASAITVVASVLILLYAVFRTELDDSFQIYKTPDYKFKIGNLFIERPVSEQFKQLQRWIIFIAWSCLVPFYFIAMGFYIVNIWLNAAYTVTLGSFIFWFLFFPPFIFYLFYALLGFQMYIIVSSRIIRIRQVYLHEKLTKLTYRQYSASKHHRLIHFKWQQYLRTNERLVHICKHIAENSRLNNPVLSILVPYFMIIQSYLLTVILSGDRQNYLFCFAGIFECESILYLLTNECAQIDAFNKKIEYLLNKYYLVSSAAEDYKHLSLLEKFKASTFQEFGRLRSYVFCVFGNYRITSSSALQIFYFTSSYFFFIFKRES